MDKDRMQIDLYKFKHLNERINNENKQLRNENFKANEKLEIMRKVIYEFDM